MFYVPCSMYKWEQGMIDTAENCSFADLESTLARMRIAESRSKTRRVLHHMS
jgi:hypothetical protein